MRSGYLLLARRPVVVSRAMLSSYLLLLCLPLALASPAPSPQHWSNSRVNGGYFSAGFADLYRREDFDFSPNQDRVSDAYAALTGARGDDFQSHKEENTNARRREDTTFSPYDNEILKKEGITTIEIPKNTQADEIHQSTSHNTFTLGLRPKIELLPKYKIQIETNNFNTTVEQLAVVNNTVPTNQNDSLNTIPEEDENDKKEKFENQQHIDYSDIPLNQYSDYDNQNVQQFEYPLDYDHEIQVTLGPDYQQYDYQDENWQQFTQGPEIYIQETEKIPTFDFGSQSTENDVRNKPTAEPYPTVVTTANPKLTSECNCDKVQTTLTVHGSKKPDDIGKTTTITPKDDSTDSMTADNTISKDPTSNPTTEITHTTKDTSKNHDTDMIFNGQATTQPTNERQPHNPCTGHKTPEVQTGQDLPPPCTGYILPDCKSTNNQKPCVTTEYPKHTTGCKGKESEITTECHDDQQSTDNVVEKLTTVNQNSLDSTTQHIIVEHETEHTTEFTVLDITTHDQSPMQPTIENSVTETNKDQNQPTHSHSEQDVPVTTTHPTHSSTGHEPKGSQEETHKEQPEITTEPRFPVYQSTEHVMSEVPTGLYTVKDNVQPELTSTEIEIPANLPDQKPCTGNFMPEQPSKEHEVPQVPSDQQPNTDIIQPEQPCVGNVMPEQPSKEHEVPQVPSDQQPNTDIIQPEQPCVGNVMPEQPSKVHEVPQVPSDQQPNTDIIQPEQPCVGNVMPEQPSKEHEMSQVPSDQQPNTDIIQPEQPCVGNVMPKQPSKEHEVPQVPSDQQQNTDGVQPKQPTTGNEMPDVPLDQQPNKDSVQPEQPSTGNEMHDVPSDNQPDKDSFQPEQPSTGNQMSDIPSDQYPSTDVLPVESSH
ncbi:muscle M-line assembly protein unc-89-like [Homalodisca vitripennis]|uniref:muscle M-line assembly protein unc-89-like n=1 Tax=Homalodisca vitripennis TaxID=197043 RepID=UPI001EEA24F3|nr:muscle M-line assembly protein unc-89-like [Homalodisca vitripennis]